MILRAFYWAFLSIRKAQADNCSLEVTRKGIALSCYQNDNSASHEAAMLKSKLEDRNYRNAVYLKCPTLLLYKCTGISCSLTPNPGQAKSCPVHVSSHISTLNSYYYNRFPGTKTKRTTRQASMKIVTPRTISARLLRSLRTNGSRIRLKLMNVYSLNPSRARMGSREYC